MTIAATLEAPRSAPVVTDVRPGPQDLFRSLSPNTFRDAYDRGVSLSAHLESLDPSDRYRDDLDAFGRVLACSGIRTQTHPEYGVYADLFDAFDRTEQTRMLAVEWLARRWREAQTGRSASTRALYTSADQIPGGVVRPYIDAANAVVNRIVPAIPLDEVVAMTTGIRGNAYRAFYLTDVTAQERQVRVAEGAEIPVARLTGGDHTINLKKFGRVLEITYENLRRMQIDLVGLHIAQLAAQTEADRVSAALDVAVNGDGNTNTAATVHNLTTLDSGAAAGTLSLKGWLAFKMKFANPYMLRIALANEGVALQMILLNTGSANIPLVAINGAAGLGGFTAINPGLADGVRLGWTADAPSLKIVGLDTRFALLRLTEIGSDIQEVERWARRQVQSVVMSQVEGFAVLQPAAAKVLNVNA